MAAEAGQVEEEGQPDAEGRPVEASGHIHCGSTGCRASPRGVKKLGVIYEPSLNELYQKVSPHLPDGRKVREIIGALTSGEDEALPTLPPWSRSWH